MLSAAAATLRITGQKNLFKGACVHHGALEGKTFACTVKALERLVAHIWVHTFDGTKILYVYWDSVGKGDVTDKDMIFHMKFAASKLVYPSRNILMDSIDAHSKREGGACAMKLAVFDDDIIIKIGKWLPSSSRFLEFIQQKISGFSQGLATKIIRIAIFKNMEGSENHTG